MSNRRRGRPTKLGDYTTFVIVDALARGASRAEAARCAGLDERTLRLWRRQGLASESGPYQDLVRRMENAEARGRERLRAKACAPVPVAVEEATVRIFEDRKVVGRQSVGLNIEALKALLEKTSRTRDGVGHDSKGREIWFWVQEPDGRWLTTREERLIAFGLRATVADQTGGYGEVEFRAPVEWTNYYLATPSEFANAGEFFSPLRR